MTRKTRVYKDFTYASIIREAILSSKDQKATSSQIFVYIVNKHPTMFKESNSMTWKGNIRQLLSKNPEFVKLKKDEKSKLHYWKYVPLEKIEEKEREVLFRYHPLYVDGILPQKDEYYDFTPVYEYPGYYPTSYYPYSITYNPLYVEKPCYDEGCYYDQEEDCVQNEEHIMEDCVQNEHLMEGCVQNEEYLMEDCVQNDSLLRENKLKEYNDNCKENKNN